MQKKIKLNRKKIIGKILFITGLPGSGKTSIGKKLKKILEKKKINSIHLDGDELRLILNNFKYSKKERIKLSFIYLKLAEKLINDTDIIILTTVSLYREIESYNKKRDKINTFLIIKKFKKKNKSKKKIKKLYETKINYYLPKTTKKIIFNHSINKSVEEILETFS